MTKAVFTRILLTVVGANFLAQIPYYIHQYYIPAHAAPAIVGLGLMVGVLVCFTVGFAGLVRGTMAGYYLTLTFLALECLFYLQTQIVQFISGHGVLLHVWNPTDGILFVVFGLGYINFFASFWFIYFLLTKKTLLVSSKSA